MERNDERVDETRMMKELMDICNTTQGDLNSLLSVISKLENLAIRAVDRITALSNDKKEVMEFHRMLKDARESVCPIALDIMTDIDVIEDIIYERMEDEIFGGFYEDDEEKLEDGTSTDIILEDCISNLPLLEPPEPGHELDPEYLSKRIDFLTDCLHVVTAGTLQFVVTVKMLRGRVALLEEALSDAGMGFQTETEVE